MDPKVVWMVCLHPQQMVPLIIIRISQIVNNVGGLSVSNVVFVFICLRFFKFIYFIFAASLPNGVVPENGLDRRAGKKHKRKNSSRQVDGKFEFISSAKDNIEDTHTDYHPREQFKFDNNQDVNNG